MNISPEKVKKLVLLFAEITKNDIEIKINQTNITLEEYIKQMLPGVNFHTAYINVENDWL